MVPTESAVMMAVVNGVHVMFPSLALFFRDGHSSFMGCDDDNALLVSNYT